MGALELAAASRRDLAMLVVGQCCGRESSGRRGPRFASQTGLPQFAGAAAGTTRNTLCDLAEAPTRVGEAAGNQRSLS